MATRSGRRLGIAAALALLVLGGAWIGLRSLGGEPEPEEPAAVADPTSRRRLPAGEVVGTAGRYGSHVWRGIPYAEPPVGERRWRAPVAAAPWSGTREALAFGGHCVQFPSPFAGVEGDPGEIRGSEDCLTLNVYAPKLEPAAVPQGADRLPVLVWIHGGGNVIGLADFYDGGALAAREGVVVVTVNYRLGPFGWFRHAALREADADPAERSGNFGTLDLVRALEWVRENVAGFGGDPERVTIFGESAGGTNVFTLLLAPQAAGLFSGAIVQSGGTFFESAARAEHWTDDSEPGHERSSNEIAARLLVADGRAADREAARPQLAAMAPAELARFLRERSAEQLMGAYLDDREAELLLDMPRVFADGAVLPAGDPLARFARADGWNRVPVVLGTNRDENKLFLYPQPVYTRQWFGFVPRIRDPELYLATADATSAMWKATGADGPAAAMSQVSPDVFVYRFDWDEWPSFLGFDAGTFLGAAHGFEIPFVFGHWDLGPRGRILFRAENRASREELSDAMRSYWARFATAGRPGTGLDGRLPEWSAWDPAGHKFLILDSPAGGGLRMGSEPVTIEGVLASVERDPRLATPKARCWVYRELAARGRGFGRQDYDRMDCTDFPYDEFPWN